MRSIAFIFLIVFPLASPAQTAKLEWIADSKTGCKVWNSSPKPNETISWSGDCKIGLVQGWGVYTYTDGNRYVGEFKDNKVDGTGVLVVGGKTYSGSWTNGCYREGDQIAVIGTTRKECGFE